MFRFSLVPRDPRFFDYFEKAGANLVQMAQVLEMLLSTYSDVGTHIERLRVLEHDGDDITRDVMRALNRTFITPLDREDITALIRALDDVADKIWAGALRLQIFQIQEPTDTARALARVLTQMAQELVAALPLLRARGDMQRILPIADRLGLLETEADDHLRAGLGKLFTDPVSIESLTLAIKWREIYDFLEGATDMADDAANVLEAIVLKHG